MATVLTITDVTYVAAIAGVLPSEPSIKRNTIEAQWVLVPLLQHLLLFEGDHLPPFDTILQSLRSSLMTTFSTHAPLGSKLRYLVDTGDVAICCSTGGGDDDDARFVAPECDANVGHLAGDEDHGVLMFKHLVLELDTSLPPAPLLVVQATRLAGGRLALGVSVHHAIADGPSL